MHLLQILGAIIIHVMTWSYHLVENAWLLYLSGIVNVVNLFSHISYNNNRTVVEIMFLPAVNSFLLYAYIISISNTVVIIVTTVSTEKVIFNLNCSQIHVPCNSQLIIE